LYNILGLSDKRSSNNSAQDFLDFQQWPLGMRIKSTPELL